MNTQATRPVGEERRYEPDGLLRLGATVERLRRKLSEAGADADTRALVELAKGILMERLHCGPAEAAWQLDQLARESGTALLDLAADVVNQVSNDPVARIVRESPAAQAAGARQDPSLGARLRAAESGVLNASDTQSAAHSVHAHVLAPLGARAVAIWAVVHDGSLTLAGHAGFSAAEARRWRHVPPGVATPAHQALRERRSVWVGDDRAAGTASIALPAAGAPVACRAVVPAEHAGRILGVLEVCWDHPIEYPSPQVHRQLESLAQLCAHTLEAEPQEAGPDSSAALAASDGPAILSDIADSLLDSAVVLRPVYGADGHVADFRIDYVNERFVDLAGRPGSTIAGLPFLEAYPLAVAEGNLFEKIERVYATGESFRSDHVVLTTLVDQVPIPTVAAIGLSRSADAVLLTWRLHDETSRLATLLQHAQRLGRIGGFEEDFVTGETTWNAQLFNLYGLAPTTPPIPLERLREYAHPDDATAIGRFLRTVLHHRRPASTAFRLQRADGVMRHIRVVAEPVADDSGLLIAVRGACQDISAQHWTETALAVTRDRLAHSEQESAERNRLALQLQNAIMPMAPEPIEAFGLHIAVRYRPAEMEHLVGGDWYDAVVLPNKQVLLAVGDVAGHGIDAATDMVALRNALRGLAATGAGPAQLLGWLNVVAYHLTDNVTATAVCGIYDPELRTLRWARAGHLPPLLVRDGNASVLPMPKGMLLGAIGTARYEEHLLALRPGDTLLMYTDGLIERRDRPLDESLGHLLAAAQRPAERLTDQLDHLLTHSNADTDDDTCVIGVQLR